MDENENTHVDSLEEANQLIRKKAGIVELLWCGSSECGHKLEESVKASLLGTPIDINEKIDGKCIICSKKAENLVRVAIAY